MEDVFQKLRNRLEEEMPVYIGYGKYHLDNPITFVILFENLDSFEIRGDNLKVIEHEGGTKMPMISLSELISDLQGIKEEYGDIQILKTEDVEEMYLAILKQKQGD